jgi:hypothetical protein
MANLARNIRGIAVEDRASSHTPAMQRFSSLLGQMDRMLRAEVALEADPGPLDRTEFDSLLRRAEAERAGVKTETEALLGLPPEDHADAALQRLALLLLMDLTAVDTTDCQRLHRLAADEPALFDIAGDDAGTQQAQVMQTAFFEMFDGLGALAEFGGAGWAGEDAEVVPIPA